ncbi:MAG: HK97 gp10 family phage protein [Selenomonadaceae bacterium]|nr:HK97 gp10 family phage protein [Selenomonadaceae bacterium]
MARRNSSGSFARHLNNRDRMRRNSIWRTMANLREMGEHVAEAVNRALKAGAYRIAADAKNRCPVDTGKLRNSIDVNQSRSGNRFVVSADAENDGYHYAAHVEFDPQINKPYMYPALDANKQQIYEDARNAASRAIATGHA